MNWKTTTAGGSGALVTIILYVLKCYGIAIPEEVIVAVLTVAMFLIGMFAKDKDKSGVFPTIGPSTNVVYKDPIPTGMNREIVVSSKPLNTDPGHDLP